LRTIEWEPSDRIPMDSSYVCGLREWAWGFDFRINSRIMQEGFLRACDRMYISIRYYSLFLREHEWSGDAAYFPAKGWFQNWLWPSEITGNTISVYECNQSFLKYDQKKFLFKPPEAWDLFSRMLRLIQNRLSDTYVVEINVE